MLRVLHPGLKVTEVAAQVSEQREAKKHPELDGQIIYEALINAKGNKTKAANFLGISRTTLWRKLLETASQKL